MIEQGRRFIQDLTSKLYYRYLPRWVDSLTIIATRQASKKLAAAGVQRVLVDNTVLAHGVTHETAWVSTGKGLWGDHEIGTGYAARIPVHNDHNQSKAARSVRYLPGIVSLAQRGKLKLAMSRELQDEQLPHPLGRYKGYGYFDLSLFSKIAFDIIEDPLYTVEFGRGTPSVREQRSKRLATKGDPLYQELMCVLGPRNSQDVWHIVTAERNDCHCFLTMDFPLIRNVQAQAKNRVIRAMKTRVLSPEVWPGVFHCPNISSIVFLSPRLISCGPSEQLAGFPA